LQLATAVATLANGGVPVHPHLLKSVQDAKTLEARTPTFARDEASVIKPEHLAIVRTAMTDVTKPGGTASVAFAGAPYATAGKTGTAQVVGIKQTERYDEKRLKREHWDHALFVAFAPADDPKLALAIVAENGQHGNSTAAPIARKVLDYYLLGKKSDAKLPEPKDVDEDEHD